jgi:hypothetical protein
MQEYGHIEFNLLLYLFEAGQKLVYADDKHREVRRNPCKEYPSAAESKWRMHSF